MNASAGLPDWLRRVYPFEPESFRTPAGARMSYVDVGPRSDEAVLMLHGNPTWSFYYGALIERVSPKARCIAPDHVGMGLSEKPAAYPYTLEQRIQDIEALVNRLGLRRVHLVVHDWGGAVGFGFATRHPTLIGRLVVLNTAAFLSRDIPRRIALCKFPGVGPLIVRGLNGFAGPAVTMAMHRRVLSPDEKRALLFPYDSWTNRVAVSAFVQDIPLQPTHPSWRTLAELEQSMGRFQQNPALVIWGGQDFCFNDGFLERWRELLPQAKVERIADAGHYVLLDADAEVVPRIAAFLTNETPS